jgi:hypothetical protein
MKFSYQFTHLELAKSLSLLGVPTVGAWLVYLVVASAMFPSIILFAAIDAETCLNWFGVMLISILIASAWAYWKRTGYPQPFQQSIEFSEDRLLHCFGHSRIECRWSLIDKVEDDVDHLRIYSQGRPILLPKRVLGDRADDCLQFLLRMTSREVNQSTNHQKESTTLPPIDLFSEKIPTGISKPYQYQVSNLDLEQAVQEKFNMVTPISISYAVSMQPERSMWRKVASLCMIWLAIGGLTLLLSQLNDRRVTLEKVVLISFGWFLPIGWLLIWRKFSWLFRTRRIRQSVPDVMSTLTLTPTGWVIANPANGTFGHWKDLQCILQSKNFIGMRMINQLVYLIPKRIFSSSEEVENFLEKSLELQRIQFAEMSGFGGPAEPGPVLETRNPYQSPQR